MSTTSSAKPKKKLRYILVVGDVTPNQYRPARLQQIKRGFSPKAVRLRDPEDFLTQVGGLPYGVRDFFIRNPEVLEDLDFELQHVTALVLNDSDNSRYATDFEECLEHVGASFERWIVGIDDSPAYCIG